MLVFLPRSITSIAPVSSSPKRLAAEAQAELLLQGRTNGVRSLDALFGRQALEPISRVHHTLSFVENIDLPFPMVTRAANIGEAIEIALDGQRKKRWDLFRGQTNANWNVTSSAERLHPPARDKALEKFKRFMSWAAATPLMKEYLGDKDALWAIAQHYGMATCFIDFTDDPTVAAFFASHTNKTPGLDQEACIICVNTADFIDFMTRYLVAAGVKTKHPEFIRIGVLNLWRLEAQRGAFLWNPIQEIERIYNFDRIIFPFTRSHESIPPPASIYPKNQSQLEQQLASFFMNEQMMRGAAEMSKLNVNTFDLSVAESEYDAKSWAGHDIPRSSDWAEVDGWETSVFETLEDVLPHPDPLLDIGLTTPELCDRIEKVLTVEFIAQYRKRGLHFLLRDSLTEESAYSPVVSRIRRLWNGMRILPYSAEEIRSSIVVTLSFLASGSQRRSPIDTWGVPSYYVEMAGDPNGLGAYSRACVTAERLAKATNPTFLECVRTHTGLDGAVLNDAAIHCLARPWERFTFSGFRELLVTEVIPTQIVWRGGDHEDSALSTVIYFSPFECKVFGLA